MDPGMPAFPESSQQISTTAAEIASKPAKPRMSTRNRFLFFFTGWLIVLMPFLFWWNTWFGRQLSDKQLTEYLQDDKRPRHIQHALVQIGERVTRHDAGVTRWYPDVVRLASYPIEEVRNTDAWVMGQDTTSKDASGAGFHNALLKVNAPQAGKITDSSALGTVIHQGGIIAKIESGSQTTEVRSPITGRLRELSARPGQSVAACDAIATLDPGTEQVWEALRALYLIGQPEDIPAIRPYQRALPEIPDHLRKQAVETEQAIRGRVPRPL
jgi:biotin carboxyl carrier protein